MFRSSWLDVLLANIRNTSLRNLGWVKKSGLNLLGLKTYYPQNMDVLRPLNFINYFLLSTGDNELLLFVHFVYFSTSLHSFSETILIKNCFSEVWPTRSQLRAFDTQVSRSSTILHPQLNYIHDSLSPTVESQNRHVARLSSWLRFFPWKKALAGTGWPSWLCCLLSHCVLE